jgi:hypothetical protein
MTEFGLGRDALGKIDRDCQETVEAAVRLAMASPEPEGWTARTHVFAERGSGR